MRTPAAPVVLDYLNTHDFARDPRTDPLAGDLGSERARPVEVGALPDMLTFTLGGALLLVANEGEPSADYTRDPEGSVSAIDVRQALARR